MCDKLILTRHMYLESKFKHCFSCVIDSKCLCYTRLKKKETFSCQEFRSSLQLYVFMNVDKSSITSQMSCFLSPREALNVTMLAKLLVNPNTGKEVEWSYGGQTFTEAGRPSSCLSLTSGASPEAEGVKAVLTFSALALSLNCLVFPNDLGFKTHNKVLNSIIVILEWITPRLIQLLIHVCFYVCICAPPV